MSDQTHRLSVDPFAIYNAGIHRAVTANRNDRLAADRICTICQWRRSDENSRTCTACRQKRARARKT